MVSEWKEVRLGDITSLIGDGLHGTPKYKENGDCFFINGNNLVSGFINIKNDTKRVDSEEAKKYEKPLSEKTIWPEGSPPNLQLFSFIFLIT